MKIEQLIYFVETAKNEHVGKAAKILGISSSAISHSISSLEGELGVELFERKGKNIYLTESGENLLNRAEHLITQFQNLRHDILGEDQLKRHYKISASHTLSSRFVTNAWNNIYSEFQNTTVDLLTLRSSEVVKSVLSRESDFGICFSPQDHPDLTLQCLYQGQLYINTRKNHPICKKRDQLKSIDQHLAVLPKSYEGVDLCYQHPMFEKFGITPKANFLTDSYDISSQLILNSNYWGLTPDLLIDSRQFHTLKSRQWYAPYNICLVYRTQKNCPNIVHRLAEELEGLFKAGQSA